MFDGYITSGESSFVQSFVPNYTQIGEQMWEICIANSCTLLGTEWRLLRVTIVWNCIPNGRKVENERKNVIDTLQSVQLSVQRFSRNSELFGFFQSRSTPTAPNFIRICQEIWEIRL